MPNDQNLTQRLREAIYNLSVETATCAVFWTQANQDAVPMHQAEIDEIINEIAAALAERDELRTKLERVRGLDRWYLCSYDGYYGGPTQKDDYGDCVMWDDLAAILAKDTTT